MKKTLPCLALLSLLAPALADTGILPNPSFEEAADGRPAGWRLYLTPPDVPGNFYVTGASEGEDAKTGSCALLVEFHEDAEVAQCAWTADPTHGGAAVSPGKYSCSFWIKARGLIDRQHVWLSIVGFDKDRQRLGEIARSDYLFAKDLPQDEWTLVRFSFDILPDAAVARVAPTLVFKTHPSGSPNHVPTTTRILVDDIALTGP